MPRLNITVTADALDGIIRAAFVRLGYASPTDDQRDAITEFVKGQDVFVCLPLEKAIACVLPPCLSSSII